MPVKKTTTKKVSPSVKKVIKPVKEVKIKVKASKGVDLEKLLEVGAHFGHQVRRWNPRMRPFIYGQEEGVHIFDLVKTKELMEEAIKVLKEAKKEGKTILFVGTKKQAQAKTREVAEKLGAPYIVQRFLGGTFTNFDQIKKSTKKLADMKKDLASGAYDTFTKKERLLIAREIERLEKNFGGIAKMDSLPDFIVIIDTRREKAAVRESNKMGVKIVGLVDSNANPDEVDYIVPMNDDAATSVNYFLETLEKELI